jgi:nucleoid DNA-binding protein
LNRTDIVRAVSNHESLPISLCEKVIGGLLDVLALSLAAGEPVNLRRFGKFEPRLRGPVTRRNPKTGAQIDVPEKVSVGFVPSPALKDRINGIESGDTSED